MTYESFIHLSRYARWLPEHSRRETWEETVSRWFHYMDDRFPMLQEYVRKHGVYRAVLNQEVMPSMRALTTAGKALDRNDIAAYNCAYVCIDDISAFSEVLLILMHGTGVGYSVERQYINLLPEVPKTLLPSDAVIVVEDSKEGWYYALASLLQQLYKGHIVKYDLHKIRKAGTRLKTFGGRASGREPLDKLFKFIIKTFTGAAGRKLNSIECHDILCNIASAVIVGGVRRSAMLCLSNLSDNRMRHAKSGAWYTEEPQRAYANNSVAYTEKPDIGSFMSEWLSIYESRSGERGIFNRVATADKSFLIGRDRRDFGTNPCGEIVLRSQQFCNLTEVIVRSDDNQASIKNKIIVATIIGTMQSAMTDFKGLRPAWKENCEDERLLGVSLSGIYDHKVMCGMAGKHILREWLHDFKDTARLTNKNVAKLLGINASKAITTIKPSGTVSQLVNCSSGIHPRYSKFYIRRVRLSVLDPLSVWLKEQGVPSEPDVNDAANIIFVFPVRAPETATTVDQVSAKEHLDLWLLYRTYYTDHNPSITVNLKSNEWLTTASWIWDNWDLIGGLTVLPYDDHIYTQAPYEAITEDRYNELVSAMPEVDVKSFKESEDNTVTAKEFSCSAGGCEI